MNWQEAPDIKSEIEKVIRRISLDCIDPERIFCFRSYGSSSRARARIWSLPRIWQQALKTKPAYCIEVLAEKFDHLSSEQKTKTLIHELLHIPKNFSGSLLAHRRSLGLAFERRVEILFEKAFKFLK